MSSAEAHAGEKKRRDEMEARRAKAVEQATPPSRTSSRCAATPSASGRRCSRAIKRRNRASAGYFGYFGPSVRCSTMPRHVAGFGVGRDEKSGTFVLEVLKPAAVAARRDRWWPR